MKTINHNHLRTKKVSDGDMALFESEIGYKLPFELKEFYRNFYSLEFDGNKLFKIHNEMIILKGNEKLEVGVHRILLFSEIKKVLKYESDEDGYKDYFDKYWSDYLPVISPLGDNGYFMVGVMNYNQDEVIFISYSDDTIVRVTSNIFNLFNKYFEDY